MKESDLSTTFYFLAATANNIAKDHGWWDEGLEATPLESHMLFVNEIAESVEEIRDGRAMDEIYYKHESNCRLVTMGWLDRPFHAQGSEHPFCTCTPKPEGSPVELADAFIRVFDYLGEHDLTPAFIRAYVEKTEYNRTRPHRHGGKAK